MSFKPSARKPLERMKMKSEMSETQAEAVYLDTDGAAKLLGVSPETVKPLLKAWRESNGKVGLPHAVIGCKLIRTTREDVRRYYEAQKKRTGSAAER